MKILMTNNGPWGTGSFTAIDALIKEFTAQGHQVRVLFPDNGLASVDYDHYCSRPDIYHIWDFPIKKDDIELPSFPLMITDPHPRNPYPCIFKSLTSAQISLFHSEFEQRLQQEIADFQPDIIECHHIWYMAYVVKELGYPYICVAHHSDQMGYRFDPRIRPIADEVAKSAQFVFAISEFVQQDVSTMYPIDTERVVTITNGYDDVLFCPKNADRKALFCEYDLAIPEDATIVSFAGKLCTNKGVDTILQANRYLAEDSNIHFVLMGAGRIDDITGAMRRDEYSLERVHFVGHQPPAVVARFHQIAAMSVMPSRSEGFGIACVEAMGCGLPVIVTRCGGPESYAVGETIDVDAPEQLAQAVNKIANLSHEDYQTLSQQAQDVAAQHRWDSIVKKRLTYYEKL